MTTVKTIHGKRSINKGLYAHCCYLKKMYGYYPSILLYRWHQIPKLKCFSSRLEVVFQCPIHWNRVLSREWRCSWSSADRRCSNYIWVTNNFIAYKVAAYIRGLGLCQGQEGSGMFGLIMMTSSNGNIFRVTGPLCGEFTGPRWIPRTKASDAELCCFLWSAPE